MEFRQEKDNRASERTDVGTVSVAVALSEYDSINAASNEANADCHTGERSRLLSCLV